MVALAVLEFGVATIGVQIRPPPPVHTDFASYYMAGVFAREGRSPYDAAALVARAAELGLHQSTYPFVYPPPFALAMRPLAALPFARARAVWMLIGAAALAGALAVTLRLLQVQARALALDTTPIWLVYTAFVAATLNSSGVHSDVRVGSVGMLLLLCFAVIAWRMTSGGRPAWLTGAALALAVLVKLAPLVVVAWAGWRGARRAVLVALGLVAVSMLPALAVWGPDVFADWVRDGVLARAAVFSGWAHNQSLDAVFQRLFNPHAMQAEQPHVAPAPRVAAVLCSVTLVVATAWALVSTRRRRERASGIVAPAGRAPQLNPELAPVELGVVVLALFLTMSITWVHTLAAIAFVWPTQMLVLCRAVGDGVPRARAAMLACCAGFFLSSAHLPVLWPSRWHQGAGMWLTAAPCVGMLVLWAVGVRTLYFRSSRPSS